MSLFLRIADELDISFTRTSRIIFENINFRSKISENEWNKHLSVAGVIRGEEDPSLIICSGNTTNPRVYREIKVVLEKKINQEISRIPFFLDEKTRKYKAEFPTRFQSRINPDGFLPIDFEFTMDKERLLNMFIYGMYTYRYEAIRELIKNCIDATRRMSSSKNGEPYFAEIVFELSGDNRTLTVTDNGIGLNEYEIKHYLTKIGRSFYSSEEFNHEFTPLSEFGIGILSAFMLTSRIEI